MQHSSIVSHISDWMKDYAQGAGAKGFVVGISGGVDSALTSALAAMTGLEVLAVGMPIRQDEAQLARSREHMAWLKAKFPNVRTSETNLSDVFGWLENSLPRGENAETEGLALANTRSRLRMATLYYLAQINGLLVAGTGNKVEDFGVGFFTKYGDGGVDLSPIADLTKTEVFALARHLGVVNSILIAPPTDGLWGDDRTDEQQLGASYPELERAMAFAEGGGNPESLSGRDAEVLAIYVKFHRANHHKMVPIPVCKIPGEWKV
jgi:NAD+ synthase